jgi:4-amino-4-deoxy-L-arabinose transferase-like glycosyltransferase
VSGAAPAPRALRYARDTLWIGGVALVARLGVAAWAAGRFPPAADGIYYTRLAERLASGAGYTWLWPDGAVTHAAHYPVGYPAMLALVWGVAGVGPVGALVLHAALGALGCVAVHRVLCRLRRRGVAAMGGLLCALHPALVAYTAAFMTEGITAALVAAAAWACMRARMRGSPRVGWWIATGAVLGAATLVRPASLLLAPIFGWIARGRSRARALAGAAVVSAAALAVCAPWTLRNCARMGACALVSVNGGWNLLIGTQAEGRGGWSELRTPPACAEVFDEAKKDACFARAALERIRAAPLAWLALARDKLAVTFDYCGAAGWYLHASSPRAFDASDKLALGVVETAYIRLALLFALAAAWPARLGRGRSRARRMACAAAVIAGVACALGRNGWVAHLLLVAALCLSARGRAWVAPGAAAATVGTLALVHAGFFGAGRYQLVALPLVTALAAVGLARVSGRARRLAGRFGRRAAAKP